MSIRVAPWTCRRKRLEKRPGRRRPGRHEKKPGPREPGLRYWPREADTITFQKGLLNCRATGGGGHMRDATAQRANTMILIRAMQQPPEPHVRHAKTGASIKSANYEGQRCALLTTKSRNTCTRATVFNSSG